MSRDSVTPSAEVEVFAVQRRRRYSAAEKQRMVEETLTSYPYPSTHWRQMRTNDPLERIIREIRRRTRVVGAFPDGNSALMFTTDDRESGAAA